MVREMNAMSRRLLADRQWQALVSVTGRKTVVPKPPKPPGREAPPKRASPSQVKSALSGLRALINRPGTESETLDYFQEVLTGFGGVGVGAGGNRNDRGAAILLATNLENSLQIALERKSATAKNHRTRDFAAKIRAGYETGLFGEETKTTLDIIRVMRNVFAHAPSPVRFSTVEIETACALLKVPARVGAVDDQKDTTATGRERFRLACERIGAALRYVPPKSTTS
jgi:hypothetical protein